MSKKIIFGLVSIIFFSGFNLARADVVINEVQLNPTDGRFIELYNSGSSSVDLTGWYIQRKTATGSSFGSLVSGPNFEGKTIGANDYFLISKVALNNSDIVLDALTLTESNTIQIKNSKQEVVDKVGWGSASDCNSVCAPNPTDGNSIQKTANGWIVAVPTPRTATQALQDNNTNLDSNTNTVVTTGTTSSATTTTETKISPKIVEIPSIKTKITSQSYTFAGLPMTFQASATGYSGEPRYFGKYFWNFGDGDSKEINADQINKFSHTYFYPGEYAVTLEYFSNSLQDIPDATDKFTLKVVPIDVSISSVGDDKDFFVELFNNSVYDTDISNWYLDSGGKSFIFPKNTIIQSKKKIIISSKITGFIIEDKSNLKLMTPEKEVVYDYSLPNIPVAKNIVSSNTDTSGNATKISAKNLTASAVSALAESSGTKNISNNYLYFGALAGFLTLAGFAVYFVRKNNISLNSGDDFEILDE